VSEKFGIAAAAATLTPGRPLVIVDADEVILRFVAGLDQFLRSRSLYLDLVSYRLHGNIKRSDDKSPVLDVEVTALLEEFRRDLDTLEAVDGAVDALRLIAEKANVVILSNVTKEQAISRQRNLVRCGFPYPLVCNTGSKGPAVRDLVVRAGPSFFVDDIGPHLSSVASNAPRVFRIHMVGDERLKSVLPHCEHAHLRADDWKAAAAFIFDRIKRAA
jgi:hypothetical protein